MGRGERRVPEQFLDMADVGAPFQQMRGKGVPEHVAGDTPKPGAEGCFSQDSVHRVGV